MLRRALEHHHRNPSARAAQTAETPHALVSVVLVSTAFSAPVLTQDAKSGAIPFRRRELKRLGCREEWRWMHRRCCGHDHWLGRMMLPVRPRVALLRSCVGHRRRICGSKDHVSNDLDEWTNAEICRRQGRGHVVHVRISTPQLRYYGKDGNRIYSNED